MAVDPKKTPAQPPSDAGKTGTTPPDTTTAPPETEAKDQDAGADTTLSALARDGSKGETKQPGGEATKADTDTGELKVAVPQGLTMAKAVLDGYHAMAKEAKLSGPQAQAALDFYAKQVAASNTAHSAFLQTQGEKWTAEVKADPEFGGAKWGETQAHAKRALAQFTDPAFIEFMNATRLGSHPAMVKLFAKVGKAIAEDTVADSSGKPAKSSRLDELRKQYPKSPELFEPKG